MDCSWGCSSQKEQSVVVAVTDNGEAVENRTPAACLSTGRRSVIVYEVENACMK